MGFLSCLKGFSRLAWETWGGKQGTSSHPGEWGREGKNPASLWVQSQAQGLGLLPHAQG